MPFDSVIASEQVRTFKSRVLAGLGESYASPVFSSGDMSEGFLNLPSPPSPHEDETVAARYEPADGQMDGVIMRRRERGSVR